MSSSPTIYLHVWTGAAAQARALVEERFPGAKIEELSHRQLRDGGWKRQVRGLHALRGQALLVYFERMEDSPQLQLVIWSGLIHRCRETIVADSLGKFQVFRRSDWFWLFPKAMASALSDSFVLVFSLALLTSWKKLGRPQPFVQAANRMAVAYLFPYPLVRDVAGGAISHIRGVLGGMAANGSTCEIYSGAALPVDVFPLRMIPAKRRLFLFWETLMLSYSFQFARDVRRRLGSARPAMFYQRHGRFTVAGALLSQWLHIPLVLEYNASELWMADYWDPTRFRTWLRLCEEVSLRCASMIVVVSEPIRQELLQRGIPANRITVSPNAVDPDHFHPGCGGERVREQIGLDRNQIVVAFVGSFSHWHGVPILQEAIREMLQGKSCDPVRFLLVGQGPLQGEMRRSLSRFEEARQVVFTGILPHDQIRSYLDAADILVSPHVPLPDGRPFFGSPTKLFEYMAMGKAIVASRLDQLAEVLTHDDTALLITPGSVEELVAAIRLLAQDAALRHRLGERARAVAIERHTWQQNAARVLKFVTPSPLTRNYDEKPDMPRGGIEKQTISTL
jgi:glycosyltransferase involved in cell wall biosynthesis